MPENQYTSVEDERNNILEIIGGPFESPFDGNLYVIRVNGCLYGSTHNDTCKTTIYQIKRILLVMDELKIKINMPDDDYNELFFYIDSLSTSILVTLKCPDVIY